MLLSCVNEFLQWCACYVGDGKSGRLYINLARACKKKFESIRRRKLYLFTRKYSTPSAVLEGIKTYVYRNPRTANRLYTINIIPCSSTPHFWGDCNVFTIKSRDLHTLNEKGFSASMCLSRKKPQIHSINMHNPHCITVLSCISKYGDVNCDKQYCLIRIIYANLLT